MKKYIFFIFIFFFYFNIDAQNKLDSDGLNNENNLYIFALKEYCKTLDSSKSQIVYVRKDNFVGNNWPKKIDTFEIQYINNIEYKKIIKKNGNHLVIVGIGPFEFEENSFFISIIPFQAEFSKGVNHLINGGGLIVYFEYNCEKKSFTYFDKKWYGL